MRCDVGLSGRAAFRIADSVSRVRFSPSHRICYSPIRVIPSEHRSKRVLKRLPAVLLKAIIPCGDSEEQQ